MPTRTSLSVTLNVQGTDVVIASDDIDNFVFTLPAPIDFGTWEDFLRYLQTQWGIPPIKIPDLSSVPALQNAYKQVTGVARVRLTTLIVDQPRKTYAIGVTFGFDTPETLIPGVGFKNVGVMVRIQPTEFKLVADLGAGETSLKLPANITIAERGKVMVRIEDELMDAVFDDAASTFTLTRATNGTNKAHAAGATVLLWDVPEPTPA